MIRYRCHAFRFRTLDPRYIRRREIFLNRFERRSKVGCPVRFRPVSFGLRIVRHPGARSFHVPFTGGAR